MKFGKAKARPEDDTNVSADVPQKPKDPYVLAREEWNDRYGDYIASAKNWRSVAVITSLVALVSVGGLAYVGAQDKYIPYIVEVDKLGQAANVGYATQASPVDQRIFKAFLVRFLSDFRSVTPDAVAQKAALDRLYSMVPTGSPALEKINTFYKDNSPFMVAQSQTVALEINSVLPISGQTWQMEWTETKRNLSGQIQSRIRYKASLTVALNPPQNEGLMLVNPLGLFVMDLNWSQQL